MSMRRRLPALVLLAVVLTTAAVAVYAVRARRAKARGDQMSSAQQHTMPEMPRPGEQAKGGSPAETARGDVTVDPRRQQLIGVRTVRVVRTTIAPSIRAVGVVRNDETRQSDVNVKVEGWIRDLYVDYTGQAVRRG